MEWQAFVVNLHKFCSFPKDSAEGLSHLENKLFKEGFKIVFFYEHLVNFSIQKLRYTNQSFKSHVLIFQIFVAD